MAVAQGVGGSMLFVARLGLLLPDGHWDFDNEGTLPGQSVDSRSEFAWDSSGPLREKEWRSISIAGSNCSSKCYRTVERAHRQYEKYYRTNTVVRITYVFHPKKLIATIFANRTHSLQLLFEGVHRRRLSLFFGGRRPAGRGGGILMQGVS